MTGVRRFGGAAAQGWRGIVAPDRATLVADRDGVADALYEAMRLLRAGIPFDVAVAADDERSAVVAALARAAWPSRAAIEALAADDATREDGRRVAHLTVESLPQKAALHDFAALGETVVLRSWSERRREFLQGRLRTAYRVGAVGDPGVPSPRPRTPDGSVVVWAPGETVDRLAVVALGVADSGRPVRIVCAGGTLPGLTAEIVPPANGAGALVRASIVVDTAAADPGTALALAAWGVPLCASTTSGVQELLDGVHLYRPWDAAGVAAAVAAACCTPSPTVRPPLVHDASLGAPSSATPVTVVLRRRGDALGARDTGASLARQAGVTHDVVAVEDTAALGVAVADARGAYIAIVEDGDILAHGALAALAAALDRSGAAFAAGEALVVAVAPGRGVPQTIGATLLGRNALDPAAMLAADAAVGAHARLLFRRDALLDAGGIDPAFDALVVHEALLRVRARGEVVACERVVAVVDRRLDGTAPNRPPAPLAEEYRRFYARHPTRDARIAAQREAVLARLAAAPALPLQPPPLRLDPPRLVR